MTDKQAVRQFWNEQSCGESLYLKQGDQAGYSSQASERYRLEPYIKEFACFPAWREKRVLEIGTGLGADHQLFAENGAELSGIDLTERAISHTRRRLEVFGLQSDLQVADAESLPFADDSFDLVYSWGVLHHSPDTPTAIREVHRVLRPGGEARIMVYNYYSLIGLMLWVRYGLLRLKPFVSLASIYSTHLESPGTKAYTTSGATHLFRDFSSVKISIQLTHGDLLESEAGQRHRGLLLTLAKALWPRKFLSTFARKFGLFMLISAKK